MFQERIHGGASTILIREIRDGHIDTDEIVTVEIVPDGAVGGRSSSVRLHVTFLTLDRHRTPGAILPFRKSNFNRNIIHNKIVALPAYFGTVICSIVPVLMRGGRTWIRKCPVLHRARRQHQAAEGGSSQSDRRLEHAERRQLR